MIGSFASGAKAVTDFFSKPDELFKAGPGQEMQNSGPEPNRERRAWCPRFSVSKHKLTP
jgi:hypothetical protein